MNRRGAVRGLALLLIVQALCAAPLLADAPGASPRPEPRPHQGPGAAARLLPAPGAVPRSPAVTPAQPRIEVASLGAAPRRSPRPEARPARRVVATRGPAAPSGPVTAICGDAAIRGQSLPPIAGKIPACAVARPVRVASVAGVALSRPAVMDCPTARALKTWIETGARPALGGLGGGLAGLRVVDGYSCRPRNNEKGAKVSEHGKGHALDISALVLRDGRAVTVSKGWTDPARGRMLRRMHDAACGPFGTVLGPEANRLHRDHFHFDTARYRAGSYCR